MECFSNLATQLLNNINDVLFSEEKRAAYNSQLLAVTTKQDDITQQAKRQKKQSSSSGRETNHIKSYAEIILNEVIEDLVREGYIQRNDSNLSDYSSMILQIVGNSSTQNDTKICWKTKGSFGELISEISFAGLFYVSGTQGSIVISFVLNIFIRRPKKETHSPFFRQFIEFFHEDKGLIDFYILASGKSYIPGWTQNAKVRNPLCKQLRDNAVYNTLLIDEGAVVKQAIDKAILKLYETSFIVLTGKRESCPFCFS